MSWGDVPFSELYAEPSRNGLSRPRAVRGEGFKMVNMGELFQYERISAQPMELVPMNTREQSTFFLRNGDLLFARQSLVIEGAGKCSIVLDLNEPTTFESHLIRVRLNQELADPRFYFNFFRSSLGKARMKSIVMQVAAAGIRGSELATLPVPLPPLLTQRRIADILSAYDDLIENNTRRIAILEEMARSLYREWFVNFRFPGNEDVEMVESEIGPVPADWPIVAATDAVEINPRIRVDRGEPKPFVAMKDLPESAMTVAPSETRVGSSGSKFQNADTLFARITPCLENGKTAFVQFLESDSDVATGSTEFIVLRSRTLTPEYVYCMARSDPFRANAIASMSGASGRQRVREESLAKFLLAHPQKRVLETFGRIAEPNFSLVEVLSRKNAVLRKTRDLLLPKLIAGELSVEVADEELAAAGS